jgi:hypothetical protein
LVKYRIPRIHPGTEHAATLCRGRQRPATALEHSAVTAVACPASNQSLAEIQKPVRTVPVGSIAEPAWGQSTRVLHFILAVPSFTPPDSVQHLLRHQPVPVCVKTFSDFFSYAATWSSQFKLRLLATLSLCCIESNQGPTRLLTTTRQEVGGSAVDILQYRRNCVAPRVLDPKSLSASRLPYNPFLPLATSD